MNKINIYEYSGIVCPGAVFIVGLCFVFPESQEYAKDFSLGGLGLFLLLSFCVGNIIQGAANILEDLTGYPKKITNAIFQKNHINKSYREIYGLIARNGKTERIDVFNKQYGLMRGMFMNFILLLVSAPFSYIGNEFYIVCSALAAICLYRAIHFANLYSKELVSEYKISNRKK